MSLSRLKWGVLKIVHAASFEKSSILGPTFVFSGIRTNKYLIERQPCYSLGHRGKERAPQKDYGYIQT